MSVRPGLLITGASGFVGHSAVALGRLSFDVVAAGRGERPNWLPSDVTWCPVDLLDRMSVGRLPANMPFVLHLASETVPSQFVDYGPLINSVEMTLNLCRHLKSGRVLFASSCLVYGSSLDIITEDHQLSPRGHYGMAKAMCESILLNATNIDGLVARPFNHIGPGMRPDLALPSIVRRLRDANDGAIIEMAGLDSTRDFLDVEDIVGAYFKILTASDHSFRVFNVCSGSGTSIGKIVYTIASILNKSIKGIKFTERCNSADDTSTIIGNNVRLRNEIGWVQKYNVEQSLSRLIAETRHL